MHPAVSFIILLTGLTFSSRRLGHWQMLHQAHHSRREL